MRQRLGIAAALLGDPRVLLFDEPINGLDLDGVRWIRGLLRRLADEGRTVLVSSHLMSEMQQTADRLVVIGRGRLIADATTEEILRGLGSRQVRRPHARSPDELARPAPGPRLHGAARRRARAAGRGRHRRGRRRARQLPLASRCTTCPRSQQSLEHAYLELTGDSVEFHGGAAAARTTTEAAQ